MTNTPEGWVKKQIKRILKTNNIAFSMKTTMGYGKSGWPDFDIVLFGIYVTIEAKYEIESNPPTTLQRETMAEIRKSGGITLLVDRFNYVRLEPFIRDCEDHATVPDVFRLLAIQHNLYLDDV